MNPLGVGGKALGLGNLSGAKGTLDGVVYTPLGGFRHPSDCTSLTASIAQSLLVSPYFLVRLSLDRTQRQSADDVPLCE
jgi:hypothetical protein